jgi:hypothetical protein
MYSSTMKVVVAVSTIAVFGFVMGGAQAAADLEARL